MKTRPVLFNGPMVRALLDGSKTQTRRVFKQAYGLSLSVDCDEDGNAELSWLSGDGPGYPVQETVRKVACPYGKPGDQLYVREAIRLHQDAGYGDVPMISLYVADGAITAADAWPWKRSYLPPMHCPMGLSRITLEIVSVRVERLQNISEADAWNEGIGPRIGSGETFCDHPVSAYRKLWESINGTGSWDANPWVWAVEFRRIEA